MNTLEIARSYDCSLPQSQIDVMAGYNAKLNYEIAKAEVDLKRKWVTNEQRLWLQYGLEDMKLHFKTYLAMLGVTVYKDYSGDLIFALSDSNGNKISSKKLLNIKDFEGEILVSEMFGGKSALQISWNGRDNSHVFFPNFAQGISPNAFLKKLKSHGVLFQVSGRTEKKAAEALLAYSVQSARITEIPSYYGWCKWSDGHWRFAREGEMTMRRILEYGE